MNYSNLSQFKGKLENTQLSQNNMRHQNSSRFVTRNQVYQNGQMKSQYPMPKITQYRQQNPQRQNTGLPFELGSKGIHILYHSSYCSHCKEFLTQLRKKNHIYSLFQFFNVDEAKVRQNLPRIVKVVPSILVPGHKKVLSGKEIFSWLDKIGRTTQTVSSQPQPFMSSEMGNSIGGDSYSYLGQVGDKPFDEKTDNMRHSFTFLKEGFQSIPTIPEDENTSRRKTKKLDAKQPQPQVFNRPPLKQGNGGVPPLPPISDSSFDNKDVNRALEDLKNRREQKI